MQDPRSGLCRHIEKLRRYAHALVGNPAEADDLIHDSLTRALTRIGLGGATLDLQEYLFSIFHEVRTEHLRVSRALGGNDAAAAVTRIAKIRCDRRDFPAALAALPEEIRRIVLLVGFAGFGYEGAATVLGVSVKTVMSRLAVGRETLRRTIMRASGQNGSDFVYFPSRNALLARSACAPGASVASS